jgi:putative ABC transport system permease protein
VSIQTLALSGVSEGLNKGEFRTLITADQLTIAKLEQALPSILNQRQRILKPNVGQHPFSRISQRAEKMLSVLLILILIMCGSAAATLADHSVKHYTQTATVLRCMGVNRNAVVLALLIQLTLLAMLSSALASVSAWLVQPSFTQIMQPHMQLLPSPLTWFVFMQPLAIALITILAFVAPKLRSLSTFPVIHVLRGIALKKPNSLLSLSIVSSLSIGLLYLNSDNVKLTIMMVTAVLAVTILSLIFAWCLSKLCAHTHHFFKGTTKVAIRSIGRSPQRHFASLLSISIAMMAILMTVTLRGSFIDLLQIQTIEQDGNYIYNGLSEGSKQDFIDALKINSAELKNMHPVVKARLIMVNGIAIEKAVNNESDSREEVRSKVRLSWANAKPNNNKLLNGEWPQIGTNDVSVEAEVMSDLGLSIGDVLSFEIGGRILNSRISSRREFQVADSRVMFWFMFAPDALASFDQTMMGGFYINNADSNNNQKNSKHTLSVLTKQFPTVRITDLERQISSIRTTMIALTRLMNTALILLLGGALMLIISSSFSNAANRQSQSVLLRAFGLQNKQLFRMDLIEHIALSTVACAVGIIGVQLIGGFMFKELFAIDYQLDWLRALTLSAYIIIGFALLGWLFSFRSSQQTVRLSMQS